MDQLSAVHCVYSNNVCCYLGSCAQTRFKSGVFVMSSDIFLKLTDVGIIFHGKISDRLGFGNWFGGSSSGKSYKVEALNAINLELLHGERVGLIGLNGAGKSTLLKVMAGIYPPTTGAFNSCGHVCPMFEFATGFEMTLSGWDNMRIRGMLLGMTPDEIEEKLLDIAAFTELGEFLDYPVRTYSSGMFVRLAFAVSTSINPEILLIDEVMGAGDLQFAKKAERRMHEFMEQGKILVFSSHNMSLIKKFCDRIIWLEKGRIKADGPADIVLPEYTASQI